MDFLFSRFQKSYIIWLLVRQLLHSVSADDNLVLFHLRSSEAMLKGEKVKNILWHFENNK